MTASDYAAIVAALRAVPGVSDADVEPDADNGGLGLLRLGLTPGVDEVQVATNVGRLLRERFGLGVDADRVQLIEDPELDDEGGLASDEGHTDVHSGFGVGTGTRSGSAAQALDTDEVAPSRSGPSYAAQINVTDHHRSRVAIRRMQLVSSGLEVTSTVTLGYGDRAVSGVCTGTATPTGVHRAVAAATLRAVEQLVEGRARFETEGVEVTVTGGERTVVVAVTMVSDRGSDRLTGSATVREDVRQACIRAALDALNRRLEPILATLG